jgi:serine/threonine-protein kinase
VNIIHSIPLNAEFRFVHEPLDPASIGHERRFVGRDDELNELASRIVLSDGGAFLITGYRGVGKSTFVNRVLQQVTPHLKNLQGPAIDLIDVHLNVPPPDAHSRDHV